MTERQTLANDSVAPQESILDTRAGVRTAYPREKTVAALFEQAAAKFPNHVALVFRGQQVRYDELNALANRLAYQLQSMGVGPESLVGVCAERSVELIVALLAILKSGAAYVPFDASYPSERLRFMVNNSGVSIMLVQRALVPAVSSAGAISTIVLDDQPQNHADSTHPNPKSKATATNLAYVMYTSGSTGQPKGVMVENRAITRLVFGTNYCEFGPDEVFLQYAPVSFDASTFEIWGALLHGAKLVLMPPHASSLQELGNVIRQHQVSTMWLTAGLFNLFVDERVDDLRPIRQLLAGGDALSPRHVRKALERLPETTLINGYGPTEGTTFTCCHQMRHGDSIGSRVPIGRPISNSFVYLLDENLKQVAAGEAGELCAGGDGVARGYLNAADLTAEKFVADPFSSTPGARMYRTGDIARWMPDGSLDFLGRRDNQVKILGHRIELGEIEASLQQHPAVQQAAVIVLAGEDDAAGKRLAGYYVCGKNGTVSPAQLKEFLAAKLPPYMVPAFLVCMPAFPLTANGKVDRASFPDPAVANSAAPSLDGASESEELVANLWRQVLGTQKIGPDDNFFDLGGDSLLIVAVHAQLQKQMQREIQVTELFEYVTVRSLARHLQSSLPAKPTFSLAQEQARKQREALAQRRSMRGNS